MIREEVRIRILFIYSLDNVPSAEKPLLSYTDMQVGISYISSVLKGRGHDTRLLVLCSDLVKASRKLIDEVVDEYDPRLVCFTAVSSQYRFMEQIASYIRAHWPEKYLLAGGPHPSLNPDEAIAGAFDAVCVGEGEFPTLELVEQLERGGSPTDIANLWMKMDDGKIQENATRPFLQDLDVLPFPDREMWQSWVQELPGRKHLQMVLLGRGCPYLCTYCSNHALTKLASGKYVRFRSPERILEEISMLRGELPGLQEIYLEVEAIATNKKWLFSLCEQLEAFNARQEESIGYWCNFRVTKQSVDPAVFHALKKANFVRINIGLESGSERVRREILKRDYSNASFLEAVSLARENGMEVNIYNLIGVPGETRIDHMETVRINQLANPDGVYTSIFFPYPGTELYNVCISQGLVSGDMDVRSERRRSALDLPEFSRREIQHAYTWFQYRVFRGRRSFSHRLRTVVDAMLDSHHSSRALFWKLLPMLRILKKLVRSRS